MQKLETLGSWIAAAILLQTLFFKFTGAEESRWIFTQLHLEPYGRIGSGIAELVLALGLLWQVTRPYAALGATGVMGGAVLSHLFVLGVSIKDDGGFLFALALIVLGICSLIVWKHRSLLLSKLKT